MPNFTLVSTRMAKLHFLHEFWGYARLVWVYPLSDMCKILRIYGQSSMGPTIHNLVASARGVKLMPQDSGVSATFVRRHPNNSYLN